MNLRGGNIAFKTLFDEPAEAPVIYLSKIQGRSQELNQRRNECLIDRYYFIARSNGPEMRYEATVKRVASEFFLSPYHASKIIINHSRQRTELKMRWKAEPIEKIKGYLSKKWPHLVW
ncbi:MAG: hypothetical protein ACT4OJ_14215 [Bacteroidota bacterium]